MAREARQWSDLDIATMDKIGEFRAAAGNPSYRKMAESTGLKFNRVMDLLKKRNGTPTLREFTTLCLLFDRRPSSVMEEVMQSLEVNHEDIDIDAWADRIKAEDSVHNN